MAKVVLKGVEKQYPNGFKAVHGIDLEIKDGEFMVFVGPSGCAKSTTLRMIAGLEDISGGEIYIGDMLVNDIPPKDRGIAMVFQSYALYPHMTVYENMAFGLKLKKTPKDEIDRRVREPKVFLFDEPLSNLDAKLRVSMRVRITQLHKELKNTMIYVTHDQVEAMTMGDRITVLKLGRIMQVDTPLNLYHKPANKFVAGFIGSPTMNLLEGNLIEESGEVYVDINGVKIKIAKEKAQKVKDHIGQRVVFGIRPENITIAEKDEKDALVGDVSVVEQMGNEEYIYFMLGGNQFISRINVEGISDGSKKGNERFYFDTSKCHIFDINTEENISL